MDKLSNLTLPDFIHMQNEECTVNFSAVCEALCQIGKKTHLRVKKSTAQQDNIFGDERDSSQILCFISLINSLESQPLFAMWPQEYVSKRVMSL